MSAACRHEWLFLHCWRTSPMWFSEIACLLCSFHMQINGGGVNLWTSGFKCSSAHSLTFFFFQNQQYSTHCLWQRAWNICLYSGEFFHMCIYCFTTYYCITKSFVVGWLFKTVFVSYLQNFLFTCRFMQTIWTWSLCCMYEKEKWKMEMKWISTKNVNVQIVDY